MADYKVPAVYIWNGSEWVLALPFWFEAAFGYLQDDYFSSDGTTWRTV